MRSIIICLISICLVASLDGSRFRCDYTYFPEAEGWLKFHRIPANWREARLRCHLEGGKLASPLHWGLQNSIKTIINQERASKWPIFTGIHATYSRGDFFSVEGVPLSRIPHTWAQNQPDNFDDKESCIVTADDGSIADVSCELTYPYMCYKKAPRNVVLNVCGTIDPEYNYDKRTGSCYKFHIVPRTYSRAFMACAAEGGYLTIINSNTEAQVVKEMFAKNSESSMVGKFNKHVAFVGFNDWGEHGEWLTIDGQTLDEAGYSRFASDEPNNKTGQFCGGVYRNGKLGDLWCDVNYPFICEKSPDSLLCENDAQNES